MTTRRAGFLYAVLSMALWPVPLLGILHVEAAAVVAFVAFFVAGWVAADRFREGASFRRVLATQMGLLAVPLVLLTVSLLWTPNCDYLRGALFFGLFPGITVVFAVALAYALSGTSMTHPGRLLAGVGVLIAVLGPLYDLGLHPQFYTYNHVFGGVLGPIYDEDLAVRFGLFAFRGLTLLWAALCYWIGRRLRGAKQAVGWSALVAVGIGSCYFFAAPLGINTPASTIQQRLGGHVQSEHFDIYFDPKAIDAREVPELITDHEYRYARLADQLAMDGPGRIDSYLYPDPETKAHLTGAGATNVAPVWLAQPQLHLVQDRYAASFGHELAHVFSREFGLSGVRASVAVGLVEGLAVALEPPDGRPTPHEQVAVAVTRDTTRTWADWRADIAGRLSAFGFWTGRGAVSYTTMGSFVRFLLDRYGVARFKRAYPWAALEAAYGKPVEVLVEEWQAVLLAQPVVARSTEALVTRRFARPSLFEQRCPHYVPPFRRTYEEGTYALRAGDTTRAEGHFKRALEREPRFVAAHHQLAEIRLARGEALAVIKQLDTLAVQPPSARLVLLLGDAWALQRRIDSARQQYEAALQAVPLYAHESAAGVVLRYAVAHRPDVISILTSADSARVQANRLEALPEASPPVQAWTALRHMAAYNYRAADSLWRRLPSPLVPGAPPFMQARLHRQRLVWQAQSAAYAGRYEAARQYAEHAASAFRAVGALNETRRIEDFARKVRWMEKREGEMGT